MRGESAGTIGELVRNELVSSERYPQFADPKKWEPVEAKAVSLLKSPDYGGDIRKALADAVRLEAGPGRELPSPGEALRIATARANGNPDIPTGSNREKPSKPDDILDHNIETAMEHRGVR